MADHMQHTSSTSSLSVDEEIERLRSLYPEKFTELCLMHLTFALELGTHELNALLTNRNSHPKKPRPQTPFSKRKNSDAGKRGIFGAPLTQEGISQVFQLIQFLERDDNIKQLGLFRKSGQATRQKELKSLLDNGITFDLDCGYFSAHDCACVLKTFLGELPEPLLIDSHYLAHCLVPGICHEGSMGDAKKKAFQQQIRAVQLLLLLLPQENYRLLKDLLNLLHRVTEAQSDNRMNADNLGTMFAPHILCPRKMTATELHRSAANMTKAVSFMIQNAPKLFEIPEELLIDIRTFWNEEQSKKQTQRMYSSAKTKWQTGSKYSKHQKRALAVTEPVKTVVSFADHQQSLQDDVCKDTEFHLAQLYAHVQSMPDSSKKRKLIKQFNKQNGYGTPEHPSKKHVRSKSVGEAFVKRLFSHKRGKSNYGSDVENLFEKKEDCRSKTQVSGMETARCFDVNSNLPNVANTKSDQPLRNTGKCTVVKLSSEPKSPPIDVKELNDVRRNLRMTNVTEGMVTRSKAHHQGFISQRCPDHCMCHRVLKPRSIELQVEERPRSRCSEKPVVLENGDFYHGGVLYREGIPIDPYESVREAVRKQPKRIVSNEQKRDLKQDLNDKSSQPERECRNPLVYFNTSL